MKRFQELFIHNIVLNIFKILAFFLFPILVYAQDYNSYTMFDNFEIVAPSSPSVIVNNQMYSSKEEGKDLAVLILKTSTGLEYDIGEYNQVIKKMMDQSISEGEKIADNVVDNFSSTFNRRNNMYIATYFTSPQKGIEGKYMAKKIIIKGRDRYSWSVISYNKNDTEKTFNKYKNRVK